MYFAETIVRNPGATFEVRCGAALIDAALIGAAVLGLSVLTAAIGLGPLVWMTDIPAESGLTSRYGMDLFGIVRVVLETFAAPDAAGPSYPAFASVFSWGRTEAVVSLTGALVILGLGMAYYIVCESAAGATPGKSCSAPACATRPTGRSRKARLPPQSVEAAAARRASGPFRAGQSSGRNRDRRCRRNCARGALDDPEDRGRALCRLAFGCAAFSYRIPRASRHDGRHARHRAVRLNLALERPDPMMLSRDHRRHQPHAHDKRPCRLTPPCRRRAGARSDGAGADIRDACKSAGGSDGRCLCMGTAFDPDSQGEALADRAALLACGRRGSRARAFPPARRPSR